jgi:hypothetical protein
MKTVDDEIRDKAIAFIDKAKADDCHRVSSDAEGRKLQPRCCESEDRGSHEATSAVGDVLTRRAARARAACLF